MCNIEIIFKKITTRINIGMMKKLMNMNKNGMICNEWKIEEGVGYLRKCSTAQCYIVINS
jgi:hypothetical protein